jgi:hypothetical protein
MVTLPKDGFARHAAVLLLALAVVAFAALAGSEALRLGDADRARRSGQAGVDPNALAADPSLALGSVRPGAVSPGPGIVIGRLIDRATGLPVRDAGVTLLELGRRTISLPDGQFRFDGIAPGNYTLVFGPAEGYVPGSGEARVTSEGADSGLRSLLPADPPTWIAPEYGGRVNACGSSSFSVPTDALLDSSPIQMTCIEAAEAFPAPPPPGRLPLAAVDLAPGELALVRPGRLVIELPVQPRYSTGVALDLLRLDLDRLVWTPVGSMQVEPGGRSASGDITALGTYLVAAPPFGTFQGLPGDSPAVSRLNTASSAGGAARSAFDAGTLLVFLSFDYARMRETSIAVRTVDRGGAVVFSSTRSYDAEGREDLPMVFEGGAWPPGDYVSTIYVGQPPEIRSVEWSVGRRETPTPDGTIPVLVSQSAALPPPAAVQAVAGCGVPAGWFAYTVQPGDSLLAIATRTGVSTALLVRANCLAGDRILAGQALYVPTIVWSQKPPLPVMGYPTKVVPPGQSWPTRPAGGNPGPSEPTPWFTAQPQNPIVKATRPPDPTLAPRPTADWPAPDPGLVQPAPPQPTPDLSIRRAPELPPPPPAEPIVKPSRPPDPTLAPRPTPPPLP